MNTINYIHLFSICLIPPLLITGPLLPELLLGINCLIVIYFCIKRYIILNKFFYFFIFFYLYIIFLSLTSINTFLSLESSLFYFRFTLFLVSINFALQNYKNFEKYFLFFFLFSFFLLFFDSIIQYWIGYNIFFWEPYPSRISSFFGSELKMGGYLVRFLSIIYILFLTYLISVNNIFLMKFNSFIVTLFILLFGFLIIISGERSALFLFILFILFTIILTNKKNMMLLILILSILFIVAIYIFDQSLYIRLITNTLNSINIFSDNFDVFLPDHRAIYLTTVSILKENYFFGIGPKMFRVYCEMSQYNLAGGCSTHPHNYYLQLLVETGLIGFCCVLLLFFYLLYKLFIIYFHKSDLNKKNKLIFYNIGSIICLWPLITSGSFFNNWISIIIYLNLGFAINLINNVNKENV